MQHPGSNNRGAGKVSRRGGSTAHHGWGVTEPGGPISNAKGIHQGLHGVRKPTASLSDATKRSGL